MKDGSYVVIQAFMVNDLHLKGNELIVYATIYGFTQDGEHWYYGTKGYLAEWCGATKMTVGNCLKSLVSKGLVERREKVEQGQVRIEYRAKKNVVDPSKNLTTPHKEICPNNNLEIQPNREPNNSGQGQKKHPTIEEVRAYVLEKGYHFDPQHFFDYYEASGWHMQGGKPVKSWKQCCVTWERNWQKANPQPTGRLSEYNFANREGTETRVVTDDAYDWSGYDDIRF